MFWKLHLHLAALFVIVTSQNKVGLLNDAVDGGSNLVGDIFNFFENIPKILQPPSVANVRVEENFEVTDDISINERIIADNTKEISNIDNGDNELSDVMNNTKNKESEDEASPNIIQFGKVMVDGAVGEGSEKVGGVFNFFGNIPKIFPRPIVSFKRVENKDDIKVLNGRVEEDDEVEMMENSEIDLERVEENFDVTVDISINEKNISDNTKEISNIDNGDNELSGVINITKNKESEDEDSPNIIQFGKVVVEGAVGEGSKIVGGVFNFFGNIPKIFPRPTVSFERVENNDDIEVRNGRVEEDDGEEMFENSEIELVIENKYCGVKVPASTLVEVIANISHFSTFRELVEFADVETELSMDGGVTVLAPINQAFEKLGISRFDMLFSDQDLAKQTVMGHIVNEVLCCSAISRNNGIFFNNTRRRSITGSLISFRKTASGNLYADKSQIKKTLSDKMFGNGVIHEISRLL